MSIVERTANANSKFGTGKDALEAGGNEADAKKACDELAGAEHLAGGLHDVVADNPYYWIGDTYARVAIIVAGAAAKLSRNEQDASGIDASHPAIWDYGPNLAQPANTSQQRLGVSGRGAP